MDEKEGKTMTFAITDLWKKKVLFLRHHFL